MTGTQSQPTQLEYWNGVGGQKWVEQWEALDRAIEPFGKAALAKAAPREGESVLDVGTGCGATLVALAEAVGPRGRAIGVDISAPMLAIAQDRIRQLEHAKAVEADAATTLLRREFDLVFSRFGVMFFEDSCAAFTNLHAALAEGGRITFICWRVPQENPWIALPVMAVKSVWPDAPPLPPSDGPGPFAFADPEKVKSILTNAGFRDIEIERFDAEVFLGENTEQAIEFATTSGPASRMLADASPEIRQRAREAIAKALTPHLKPGRCALAGSTWIVRARAAAKA